MGTPKEGVLQILSALLHDATFEEIQHRIHVRQAIETGLRDASEGRSLSHAEVEQRLARWIGK